MRRADESALLSRLLVHASRLGARLWRNNCGQLQDRAGRWVRYGVANPGGADLIGYLPVTITSAHVGQTFAVFVAIEAKTSTGRLSPEQSHFLTVVQRAGGVAGVARADEDAMLIFAPWMPHE
jgi:VRR-NUC domain